MGEPDASDSPPASSGNVNRYSGSSGYRHEELVALAMRIPQTECFFRALQTISEVDDSKRTANVEIGLVGESQAIVLMFLKPLLKRFADDP